MNFLEAFSVTSISRKLNLQGKKIIFQGNINYSKSKNKGQKRKTPGFSEQPNFQFVWKTEFSMSTKNAWILRGLIFKQ